uniref:BTB domain-containing protein n=1 Tax=Glossina austeni TaxID=7395 RepID=A0A1A9VGZ6_GLOAU
MRPDCLKTLNRQGCDQRDCDFIWKVNGECMYAHKAVFAAHSPFFEDIYQLSENDKENIATIKNDSVDACAMKTIIDYLYNGEIKIAEDVGQSLLVTSNFLQMDWVEQQCKQQFKSSVELGNSFSIWGFAGELNADCVFGEELADHCFRYILRHFPQLIEDEGFLKLSIEKVEAILTHDGLCVQNEENAFKSVFHWINYGPEGRKSYLGKLMKHVDSRLFKPRFLRDYARSESLLNKELLRSLSNRKRKLGCWPDDIKALSRYGIPFPADHAATYKSHKKAANHLPLNECTESLTVSPMKERSGSNCYLIRK